MRFKILRFFFLGFLATITLRLFYWQIIQSDKLQARAEVQHLKNESVLAQRGKILFSDGSILASNSPSFLLFGQPKILSAEEKESNSTKLARVLSKGVEEELEIKKKLINDFSQDLYWVPINKNIDINTKKNIEALSLKGIGFVVSSSRFYPESSSSAHLLGFLGSNNKGESTGYFGLEGYYDGELKGLAGSIRLEKDAQGLPILIGNFLTKEARNGKDLTLNIDRTIQFIIEQNLKKGIEKYGAKSAMAIVMEPKSGNILAMASFPSYDPADFTKYPKEYYKNPLVADQYEPGSTFKVLVMAAALNEDVVKPDTKCDICKGPINLGGFTIRTWNNQYEEDPTMTDVIVHSDNTGMVFSAKKIGLDKLYKYIEDYGFGSPTDIDLQDEFSPDLRPKNSWREIDLATAAFGQGVAVTPIQMVRAVSAIANGGKLMEPHVVAAISDISSTFEIKPKVVKEVIRPSSAKSITEMMVKAVEEGEAKWAKPKGYKIAGKTGTDQRPTS